MESLNSTHTQMFKEWVRFELLGVRWVIKWAVLTSKGCVFEKSRAHFREKHWVTICLWQTRFSISFHAFHQQYFSSHFTQVQCNQNVFYSNFFFHFLIIAVSATSVIINCYSFMTRMHNTSLYPKGLAT